LVGFAGVKSTYKKHSSATCSKPHTTIMSVSEPSFISKHAGKVFLTVFGISASVIVTSLCVALKKPAQSEQSEPQYNLLFEEFPAAVNKLKVQGATFGKNFVNFIRSYPLLCGVVLLLVLAGLGVGGYFIYTTQFTKPPTPDHPPAEVKPKIVSTESSSGSSVGWEIVYCIIVVVLFGLAFFLLTRFGGHLDFKILVPISVLLVAGLVLLMFFKGQIVPFVFMYPRKAIIDAANSTLEHV
jgi:hypothetical protein